MSGTTVWRSVVVLALAALTTVAVLSLVRSFAAGRDPAPTARVTTAPTGDGCDAVPVDAATGSEVAARRDLAVLTAGTYGSSFNGAGVGRCGRVWVVRVFVSGTPQDRDLPTRLPHGTVLLQVRGRPFVAG